MTGNSISLILLPTLACDAACDYCFENKTGGHLSAKQLRLIVAKVLDWLDECGSEALSIYWQGGEVMVLSPDWFAQAHELIGELAAARSKHVAHYLQSNLLAYDDSWNPIIASMFGNSVGSSMDFPNIHRKVRGGTADDYTRIWTRNVRRAKDAGIQVGTIAIPSEETMRLGAERFYSYFVDEVGLADFQINTPFSGGAPSGAKRGYPLPTEPLARFMVDLLHVWADRGAAAGISVGPFDRLMSRLAEGNRGLPCFWQSNCTDGFICVDPSGHVAQCDCWVASYPAHRFGNLLGPSSLAELLANSEARAALARRPGTLVRDEDCIACDYLALCHGGCPVRAYTAYGTLFRKDPYCEVYQAVFHAAAGMITAMPTPPGREPA